MQENIASKSQRDVYPVSTVTVIQHLLFGASGNYPRLHLHIWNNGRFSRRLATRTTTLTNPVSVPQHRPSLMPDQCTRGLVRFIDNYNVGVIGVTTD